MTPSISFLFVTLFFFADGRRVLGSLRRERTFRPCRRRRRRRRVLRRRVALVASSAGRQRRSRSVREAVLSEAEQSRCRRAADRAIDRLRSVRTVRRSSHPLRRMPTMVRERCTLLVYTETDYPWASPDFTRGQRANCSLVMLRQTMGSQFPSNLNMLAAFTAKTTKLLWPM